MLQILKYTLDEIPASTILSDIWNNKIDGIIIRNSMPLDIVNDIDTFFNNENKRLTPSGSTFPMPFAECKDNLSQVHYSNSALNFRNALEENFSIKINIFLENIFSRLVDSKTKIGTSIFENDKYHVPCTIRELEKNKGGIIVHSGKFFNNQFKSFYSLLKKNINLKKQLSFFFTIQNAELGGELTVYDAKWAEYNKKMDFYDNNFLLKKDNSKKAIKEILRQKYLFEVGDLFIFNGGEIWHRVEDILSDKSRITIGGFLSYDDNEETLYYWS